LQARPRRGVDRTARFETGSAPRESDPTGKRLIKILEGRGWYVKRIRGSHHILRHPSIPDAVPVPVHGNQADKRETLGDILRTAGVRREQFQRLL